MTERLAWARAHAQDVRRVAMCEPRGHAGLRGAILTEPGDTTAHAGVLFMDADDYHAGSVHGAMATAALARDYGLITTGDATLRLDTAAGVVQVTTTAGDAVRTGARVSIASVPAFVARGGLALAVAGRALRADVAYGGDFYAIVDAESAGVSIDGTRDADLQRLARAVADAIAPHRITQHPTRPELTGLRGVVFTGPAQRSPAEFRSVVVTTAGRVSRGVSGSGMAAVLAVLDAMGLPLDDGITLEGGLAAGWPSTRSRRSCPCCRRPSG
mgnify:FL=1